MLRLPAWDALRFGGGIVSAKDYHSRGWGFESLCGHQFSKRFQIVVGEPVQSVQRGAAMSAWCPSQDENWGLQAPQCAQDARVGVSRWAVWGRGGCRVALGGSEAALPYYDPMILSVIVLSSGSDTSTAGYCLSLKLTALDIPRNAAPSPVCLPESIGGRNDYRRACKQFHNRAPAECFL